MADADAQARRVPRWWPAPQKRPDQVPWRWERRKQLKRPLLVDHVTRRASQLHRLQHWIAVLRPRLEAQRGLQGGASPGADPGAPPAEEAALRAEEEEAGDQRSDAGEHREDPAPERRAEPPVAEPAGRPVRRTGWGRFRPPARHAATMSELQAVEAALRQLNAAQKAFWRGDPDGGWVRLHSAEEFEVLAYTWAQVEALRIRLAQEAEKGEFLAETAATLRELLTRVEQLHSQDKPSQNRRRPRRRPVNLQRARVLLRDALHLRNEHFDTQFHARRVTAVRRVLLLVIVAGTAALLLWLLWAVDNIDLNPDRPTTGSTPAEPPPAEPPPAWVLFSALAAGAIGAVVSAIQRLAVHPTTTSLVELDSLTATLTRPVIGMVAATTVYLAWLGEFVRFPEPAPVAFLWLACFGVGFTERLVVFHPPGAEKPVARA